MADQLSLILGGVRSGKSAFAERLARELDRPTLYLATGQASDAEFGERIRRHRLARPDSWVTLEEPLDIAGRLQSALAVPRPPAVILIDSLDVWVANLLLKHEQEPSSEAELQALSTLAQLLDLRAHSTATYFLVSSEVGLSPVPPNALGRHFQDLLGLVNQKVAANADRVYLVVAGIPVEVKWPS
jgi:adenosyl cobinamide kinase/adenosyl cobinamide phosphate guanylyltransferase